VERGANRAVDDAGLEAAVDVAKGNRRAGFCHVGGMGKELSCAM